MVWYRIVAKDPAEHERAMAALERLGAVTRESQAGAEGGPVENGEGAGGDR